MRQTVSFSNSGGFWATRLSFVTSCVAWVKQQMITSPIFFNKPLWVHDENTQTNNDFYAQGPVASGVTIAFNDNPSANKIYKSLSIESPDYRNILGVNTFIANKGTGNSLQKSFTVSTLNEKGGILYGGIPAQNEITVSNTEYIGTVSQVIDAVEGFEANGPLYVLDGSGSSSYTGQDAFVTSDSALVKNPGAANVIEMYDGGVFLSTGSLAVGSPVYLVYLDSNGDQAKGQFADCSLVFGNNDFEIYSINVDYEPTNLDHNS